MEANIIALLNSNLRVIIPDFGAFIIRQKLPRIIVFNEFLRYNDGLLIDFIVRTEGIDREIAEQRVSAFAEESNRLLKSGKELIIEGLGKLYKDTSGKISFTESSEIDEIQKIPNEPVKPDIQEFFRDTAVKIKPVAPKAKARVKRTTKPKRKVVKKKIPKGKKVTSIEVPQTTVPTESTEITGTTVTLGSGEPQGILKSAENTKSGEPLTLPSQVEPEIADQPLTNQIQEIYDFPAGNRTNQILAWVGGVLFVNVVILAWFVFNDEIRGIFLKSPEPSLIADSIYKQLADSVKAAALDTSLIYEQSDQKVKLLSSSPHPSSSRYYIVAGCFRDEINAEALVTSLKDLGYRAEKFGKIGNLYAVCYASFDDKEQAVQELKRIRKKVPDTWMTRF